MFAIIIPMGMAKENKGVAAFSGLAGFIAMNLSVNSYLQITNQLASADALKSKGQAMVLGIQSIEMGVLGGVIVGLIVYYLHENFKILKCQMLFHFFEELDLYQ